MKIKTRILSITTLLTFSGILLYTLNFDDPDDFPVAISFADTITFDNLEEMEEFSDAVVIGRTSDDFIDREHVNIYYEDGYLEDFYTLTNIDVHDVMHYSEDRFNFSEEIKIVEPLSIVGNEEEEVKLISEGYEELKADTDYLIFLKENIFGDMSVVWQNYGKFNLESDDIGNPDLYSSKSDYEAASEFKSNLFEEATKRYNIN
ncbi:hypothetical protein ACE1TF_10865 [Geomicrobium sp. JSM 1781026]|uniref:hypothetical protein n=1 Tax=Geomicrobium sp. JSM 1781026 TaxID=3344580 RepID=UPI0035C089FA